MTPRQGAMADDHGSMPTSANHAEPHTRWSRRSELASESTGPMPTSIQDDVLHAGDLFAAKYDTGAYSNLSLESSIRQGATDLSGIESNYALSDWTPLGGSRWTDHSVDVDAAPWFPGSRVCTRRANGACIVDTALARLWSWRWLLHSTSVVHYHRGGIIRINEERVYRECRTVLLLARLRSWFLDISEPFAPNPVRDAARSTRPQFRNCNHI